MEAQININRIRQALDDIRKSIHRLESLTEMPLEEFLSDEDSKDIARSRLLIAIEAAINVCYHIVAKRLKKVPSEYSQCFKILGEEGLLSSDLTERLVLMCKFRNRLVHLYWDVDYSVVYDITHYSLLDLKQYIREIEEDIEREKL
jgi:uncharacterized protein YutE (UPF0331/DUF86 family)